MTSKTNRTADGRHIQFGDEDTVTMPEGFTAPDDGATCSGWFGRMMENPSGGGFGAAYIEREEYDD